MLVIKSRITSFRLKAFTTCTNRVLWMAMSSHSGDFMSKYALARQ